VHLFDRSAARGGLDTHEGAVERAPIADQLDPPDTVPAAPAILLEHARAGGPQHGGPLVAERIQRAIEMRVRTPGEILRPVENLLGAHRVDRIGVGADDDSRRGDVAEQGIEDAAILATHDGIDPDEDGVQLAHARTEAIGDRVVVDNGLGADLAVGKRLEDAAKARLGRSGRGRDGITAPQEADSHVPRRPGLLRITSGAPRVARAR